MPLTSKGSRPWCEGPGPRALPSKVTIISQHRTLGTLPLLVRLVCGLDFWWPYSQECGYRSQWSTWDYLLIRLVHKDIYLSGIQTFWLGLTNAWYNYFVTSTCRMNYSLLWFFMMSSRTIQGLKIHLFSFTLLSSFPFLSPSPLPSSASFFLKTFSCSTSWTWQWPELASTCMPTQVEPTERGKWEERSYISPTSLCLGNPWLLSTSRAGLALRSHRHQDPKVLTNAPYSWTPKRLLN